MTTTFRQDIREGLFAGMTAFKVANPTMVIEVYKARPGSVEPPCLFVGAINEPTIGHDSGLRQRLALVQSVLVLRLIEANETSDAKDEMVDTWLDYCTANPRMLTAYTVQAPVSTQDVELDYAGTLYSATVVTLQAEIQEGRN